MSSNSDDIRSMLLEGVIQIDDYHIKVPASHILLHIMYDNEDKLGFCIDEVRMEDGFYCINKRWMNGMVDWLCSISNVETYLERIQNQEQSINSSKTSPLGNCRFFKLDGTDEKAAENTEEECVVFKENIKRVIFGCGHLQCCIKCTHKLLQSDKPDCPLCRKKISIAINKF